MRIGAFSLAVNRLEREGQQSLPAIEEVKKR
jgi:hypothetical protein